MAKEKKLLTEEQKAKIVSDLEEKYGFQGEDFEVLFVSVKGVEKAFAIKAPERRCWNDFRDKVAAGKTKASDLEMNLTVDCLIKDVEGCVKLEEFKKDVDFKAALPTALSGIAATLATNGLDSAKKD